MKKQQQPNGKRNSDRQQWLCCSTISKSVAVILIILNSNKKKIGNNREYYICIAKMWLCQFGFSENRRNAILCNSNSMKEALYIPKSEYIGYVFTHYFFFSFFFFLFFRVFSVLKHGCGWAIFFFFLLLLNIFVSFFVCSFRSFGLRCVLCIIINLLLSQQLNEYRIILYDFSLY